MKIRVGGPRAALGLVLTCVLPGCGSEDTSLRDGLEGLPQEVTTASAIDTLPAPVGLDVEVDTGAMVVDTTGAPGLFPGPVDTDPWVIERPTVAVLQAAPGEWTTGMVEERRPRALMTVQTSARAARHPEFDRVVLEFVGNDAPGYHLEYVDRPVRECGSGEPVAVAGDAWLMIRLEPAQAHDDRGRATLNPRAVRPGLPNVQELRMVCDFEGQVAWVIGVASPEPFRLLELSSPARLVIDVGLP